MSKSDKDPNGCVYLLEKPEDILRKFKKAVTDSETCVRYDPADKPGVSNLMTIYSAATGKSYEKSSRSSTARATARSSPPWATRWWSSCGPSGRRPTPSGRQGLSGVRLPRRRGEGGLCGQQDPAEGL